MVLRFQGVTIDGKYVTNDPRVRKPGLFNSWPSSYLGMTTDLAGEAAVRHPSWAAVGCSERRKLHPANTGEHQHVYKLSKKQLHHMKQ